MAAGEDGVPDEEATVQVSTKNMGQLAVAAAILTGGILGGAGTASAATAKASPNCIEAVTKASMTKTADEPLAAGAIALSDCGSAS